MKYLVTFLTIVGISDFSRAALFTNTFSADAFVRSNAPTVNYGGAGALSVSGSTATNASGVAMGITDTFIRFNTAVMISSFNSLFGTTNWVINGASLVVTEVGAPMNNIFNRGKGAFQISWISNDSWTEGTGMPMGPTMDGIVYTNEPSLLTNIVTLAIFTNAAANSTNSYSLPLATAFVEDMSAGGDVSLFLTALDSNTGFTFDSRSFTTPGQLPFIVISAVPTPGIAGISLSGADVTLSGTNGESGGTYRVWSSTNIFLPLNLWTPIATNVLSESGNFNITATNATSIDAPQQFFILQTQ